MVSERAIRAQIVFALRKRGHLVYSQTSGYGGLAGRPDLVVCANGRFVALEVKRPGGKPTRLQEYRLKEVERAGGIAAVVDSARAALHVLDENLQKDCQETLDNA